MPGVSDEISRHPGVPHPKIYESHSQWTSIFATDWPGTIQRVVQFAVLELMVIGCNGILFN